MVVANAANIINNNDRDHYNAKPPIFDANPEGNTLARSVVFDQQNKDFKNHHKPRTILLNVISYIEYEKITHMDSAKSIFDSLRMTHEGNAQVKETMALALIQKYKACIIEDDEKGETMFSRFQMLVARLKTMDKGYSTTDHVNKIIRSLPKKWRPMVNSLKLEKDLNSVSLKELVSYLRSHEIKLEEDEKRGKSVTLKSKPEKTISYQVEEELEGSDEDSKDDDELSLISKRVN
ncbi:uncharacterized protein LOC127137668 [Lathyrus oleraceus]|uniref:uncharacterized protein LOC127137668 n=1 Tax=Pisum sativum TaxID=3888 RepID=UPI0021CFC7E5|nr:uncharacterized protein LOC127137668 [Pisum sativum]